MRLIADIRCENSFRHTGFMEGDMTAQDEAKYHEEISGLIHELGESFLAIGGSKKNG